MADISKEDLRKEIDGDYSFCVLLLLKCLKSLKAGTLVT
jgi:hypothetical protein